jgi:hypothetical protein
MEGSFMVLLFTIFILVYQIRKNEMSRACVGRGEVHAGFWWGKRKERDPLEVLGVVGRMILK